MQSKFEEYHVPATTYLKAKENLQNNLQSLGNEANEKVLERYKTFQHPLEMIIDDLGDAKCKYELFSKVRGVEQDSFDWVKKNIIQPLRSIIRDAIESLSVEELLEITFATGRYNKTSLLAFLGELGEYTLFKAAFLKMKDKLTQDNLVSAFSILQHAYEGSRISEQLGLAAGLLGRGNIYYIAMAEWMLNALHKEGKAEGLVSRILSKENITDIPAIMAEKKACLAEKSLESFQEKSWMYCTKDEIVPDETIVKARSAMKYDLFVTQQHQEHLFWKLIHDYSTGPRLLSNYSESSNFLLQILSNEKLKISVLIVLVVGIIGLTIGTLGMAGIITALTGTAAITVVSVGGATLGASSVLAATSFFASSVQKIPSEAEQESKFLIGLSV